MSYCILKKTGSVISRTTFQRVTNLEIQTDDVKADFDDFDAKIRQRLKEEYLPNDGDKPNPQDWDEFMNHDQYFQEEFDRIYINADVPEADK